MYPSSNGMRAVKINYDSRNLRSSVSNQYSDRSATGQQDAARKFNYGFCRRWPLFSTGKSRQLQRTHTVIARVISILLMLSLQCE